MFPMNNIESNSCQRRTVLAALGSSAPAGAITGSVAADRSTKHGKGTRTSRSVEIDVTLLGSSSASEAMAFSPADVEEREAGAVRNAIESGTGTILGSPTFGMAGIVEAEDGFYELDAEYAGCETVEVPTLKAELVATVYGNAVVSEVSRFSTAAQHIAESAIGRARYLASRERRGKRPLHSERTDTDIRQERYVFDPGETVPPIFTKSDGSLVVESDGDYFTLELTKRPAPVERFEVVATSVAGDATEFDEWFLEEYVEFDGSRSVLSANEKRILQKAERRSYAETSPFSDDLRSLLEQIDAGRGSPTGKHRFMRIDNELAVISVSKGVGC